MDCGNEDNLVFCINSIDENKSWVVAGGYMKITEAKRHLWKMNAVDFIGVGGGRCCELLLIDKQSCAFSIDSHNRLFMALYNFRSANHVVSKISLVYCK